MFQAHTDPDIADAFFHNLRVHCSGKSLSELLAEIQYGAFMTPPQPIEEYWDSFIDERLCFQLKQRWEKVRAAQIQPEVEALMQPALQRLSEPEQTRVNKAFAVLGEQRWSQVSVLVAKLAFVQTTSPVNVDTLEAVINPGMFTSFTWMVEYKAPLGKVDPAVVELLKHAFSVDLGRLLHDMHGALAFSFDGIDPDWFRSQLVMDQVDECLQSAWQSVRDAQVRPEVEALLQPALQRLPEPERAHVADAFATRIKSDPCEFVALMVKHALVQSKGPVNPETVQALHTRQVLGIVGEFWEYKTIEGVGGKDLSAFLQFCVSRSIEEIVATPTGRFPQVFAKEYHAWDKFLKKFKESMSLEQA
ncbi:unnamed protein product [Symbiodinium sp. KB8]|nr:unnamed protein product [Symbiodinium sp. KB8]